MSYRPRRAAPVNLFFKVILAVMLGYRAAAEDFRLVKVKFIGYNYFANYLSTTNFITDGQICIQNCLSGITYIRNKTCFGTAVHQS